MKVDAVKSIVDETASLSLDIAPFFLSSISCAAYIFNTIMSFVFFTFISSLLFSLRHYRLLDVAVWYV